MEYTKGKLKERLINCDTHFTGDQIEAIMKVLEDSGYSKMYEALKMVKEVMDISEVDHAMQPQVGKEPYLKVLQAIAKAEGM